MTTFHPFPRLPLELREQIWKATVEPRTVDVRLVRSLGETLTLSSTPVPAILQSCREARNLGLYKRVLFEVAAVKKIKRNNEPEMGIENFFMPDEPVEPEPETEQRYVWLDLEIDIVDIGTTYFSRYKSIASEIKHLKFERENSDSFFYYSEAADLRMFVNVEEIHILCADGFWAWGGATNEHAWPCAVEKLVFIDAFDGQVARGIEMETIYRQYLKAARLEADGEAWSTGDEYES